jgi:PilZ domain
MTVSRERRSARRRRVLLSGEIIPTQCTQSMDCIIRDLSTDGAAIELPASAPDSFELRIMRDRSVRLARTVWKNGNRRGIAFADVATSSAESSKPASILDLRRTLRFEATR